MPKTLFSVFQDERFMDLTIYQYGYEKCRPLHSFGPYVRNHYLFHYVMSGKGQLRANDSQNNMKDYGISAGSGFLIEPGYINTYFADKEEPWEYMWVEFGGLRAKECMELAGLSHVHPVWRPNDPGKAELLRERLQLFLDAEGATSMELIGYLYLFVDLLIKLSANRKQTQGGRLSEFYAREAVAFVETNYSRNITVEDMAERCKLDRSYFGKIFKKVIGQSPQEFLIHYRMARAAEDLIMNDRSVGEVGQAVGYPNALHFSRAFKNVYGISPKEYRQRNKIINK